MKNAVVVFFAVMGSRGVDAGHPACVDVLGVMVGCLRKQR